MSRSERAGLALAFAAVALAAISGVASSTPGFEINLGPGDSPFVTGFQENSDVDNKVGWHWATYDARIGTPFRFTGSDLEVTLKYARVFGEEAVVSVSVSGRGAEEFRARGGEVRTTVLRVSGVEGPVELGIRTDSHERRNMGLKMDRATFAARNGGAFRLNPSALLRPVLAILLIFVGLRILGAAPVFAGASTLVSAVIFALGAQTDLFLAWRMIHFVPETVCVAIPVLWLAQKLIRRSGVDAKEAALLGAAALICVLFRVVLISHPDFYYPDLLTHARVVQAIRAEGPGFFLHPADALNAQGAWTKPVLGQTSALPYAVAFHTPFAVLAALFDLSRDQIEIAFKSGGAILSVVPILLAGALARIFGLSPLAGLLLCLIPTYASRLSFALLPALCGHVFDLLALLAIGRFAEVGEGPRRLPSWIAMIGALLIGHLAYTSSVVNEGILCAVLVLVWLVSGPIGRSRASALIVAEGLAAFCAFVLYYRHFVTDVVGLAGRLVGGGGSAGAPSVYPVEGFWPVFLERTGSFFPWPYLVLALIGILAARGQLKEKGLMIAWGLAYVVLILLRAKIPDVFRYGHETLFVTPVMMILVGAGLVIGWRRSGPSRVATLLASSGLLALSVRDQWRAMADQLGNAL